MPRFGRQDPTRSVVLDFKETKGGDALQLYTATGRDAQEWQVKQINNIMAVGDDGL